MFSSLWKAPKMGKKIKFKYFNFVYLSATHIDEELDSEAEKFSPFGSTFRTFDTTNYSLISTVDVKARSISDLSTDSLDNYLAVIEVNLLQRILFITSTRQRYCS